LVVIENWRKVGLSYKEGKMELPSQPPCPAESYDGSPAADALLLLYRCREECALLHGCGREHCVIARRWPSPWRAAPSNVGWRLFGFIALAFAGPPGAL
jgi:hypothetical protein